MVVPSRTLRIRVGSPSMICSHISQVSDILQKYLRKVVLHDVRGPNNLATELPDQAAVFDARPMGSRVIDDVSTQPMTHT